MFVSMPLFHSPHPREFQLETCVLAGFDAKLFNILAYVVIQLDVAAKAGGGCC